MTSFATYIKSSQRLVGQCCLVWELQGDTRRLTHQRDQQSAAKGELRMRPGHLAGIVLIYVGAAIAWAVLGSSVSQRTQASFTRLHSQVEGLWGTPLRQRAPALWVEETVSYEDEKGQQQSKQVRHSLVPDSSDINLKLHSDARRKGLLWYRTYVVDFDATYTVKHDYSREPVLSTCFHFPSDQADYDDFLFAVNDEAAVLSGSTHEGIWKSIPLPPGETATIEIHYNSRGLDDWTYSFGEGVSQVKNFKMVVDTDFEQIDFPPKSISPTHKERIGNGWRLTWEYTNLVSAFLTGVEAPQQVNPGQMTSRISYFAPVGLLFFVAVVVIIGLMRGQNLHPMHYFFVAGGFFAFHLLMAYVADHLDLKVTFLLCAAVSVILVVSYLIRAVGANFALKVAAPAQLIFLVLFSYTFFFKGYTGLAITVGSILTLGVLMHVTARVDWDTCFQPPSRPGPPPKTIPPAPPPLVG